MSCFFVSQLLNNNKLIKIKYLKGILGIHHINNWYWGRETKQNKQIELLSYWTLRLFLKPGVRKWLLLNGTFPRCF